MNFLHKPLELHPTVRVSASPIETFHALHDIHARQSWMQSERLWHPRTSRYDGSTETEVGQKRLYQVANAIYPIMLEETVKEYDPEERKFASYVERTDDGGMNFRIELGVQPYQEGSAIEMHVSAVGVNGLVGAFVRRHRIEREVESRLARIDGEGTAAVYAPVEPQIA